MIDAQSVLYILFALLLFVAGVLYLVLDDRVGRERQLVDRLLDRHDCDEDRDEQEVQERAS